jgi:hypothetical protein
MLYKRILRKLLKGTNLKLGKWDIIGCDGRKYPIINERALIRASNETVIPEKEIEEYISYFCHYTKNYITAEYSTINIPYMGNLKPRYKRIRYMKWLAVIAATNGYVPKRGSIERDLAYKTILLKGNKHGTQVTNNGGRLEDQDSEGRHDLYDTGV